MQFQRAHDAVLTLDGMRRLQQLPSWLLPQDDLKYSSLPAAVQQVCRIALTVANCCMRSSPSNGAHARECTTRGSPRPAGCAPRQPPRSRSSAPSLTTHSTERHTLRSLNEGTHHTKAEETMHATRRACCVCASKARSVCAPPDKQRLAWPIREPIRGRSYSLRTFSPLSTLYVVSLMEQGLTEPELFRAACASRLLAIHIVPRHTRVL